jgi:hypothetical protein
MRRRPANPASLTPPVSCADRTGGFVQETLTSCQFVAPDHLITRPAKIGRHSLGTSMTIRDYAPKIGMHEELMRSRVNAAAVVQHVLDSWSAAYSGTPEAQMLVAPSRIDKLLILPGALVSARPRTWWISGRPQPAKSPLKSAHDIPRPRSASALGRNSVWRPTDSSFGSDGIGVSFR